jgi:DNA uptake protein ComE-like DNA-binding protein
LFLGVAGVLAIVLWIGITMIQTPPPEAWDFDDLEDELDEEIAEEEAKEVKKTAGPAGIDGLDGVTKTNSKTLIAAGFDTKEKIAASSVADLTALKGIGKATATKIFNSAQS